MPRRSIVSATVLAALAVGACGGQAVDRQGARERARDVLVNRDIDPLDQDAANDAATCIADGMFNDTDVLSPDERNQVLLAIDGTRPPGDVTEKVIALVRECDALPDASGGEADAAPTGDEDASEDDGSTTTTDS